MFHALAFLSVFAAQPCSAFSNLTDFQRQIQAAAHRFRIDPRLVEAIVEVESALVASEIETQNIPPIVSPKGAEGPMQIMPPTAQELGIANPHHVLSNLMGGCEYLRRLKNQFPDDLPRVLAAYNAGPHKVRKYGGIPPYRETRNYVTKVLAAYERRKGVH